MKFRLLIFCTLLLSTNAFAAGSVFLKPAVAKTLASSVPDNGDTNPYAVAVSPVTVGSLHEGDVLVDNFNDQSNRQGLGTTIISYSPTTQQTSTFATLPRGLPGCAGGVGLSTAMTVLKSGWVIVGSTPSQDGTTATKGEGCLIVLNNVGQVATVFSDQNINDPWGNMAVDEHGDDVTLFVSNSGFAVPAPTDNSPVVKKATVLRLKLKVRGGEVPKIVEEVVVGSGFSEQPDKSVFLIGPTGLALDDKGTLYVSDSVANRIVAIDQATTRTASAETGREVASGGQLNRPLALILAPNGNLVATNGLDGQAVEIDPKTGVQVAAIWLEKDKAVSPPGSGDLFGLALRPDGKAIYYVKDDKNTLAEISFP